MNSRVVLGVVGLVVLAAGCQSTDRQRPGLFFWQRRGLTTLAEETRSADPDRRREAALALGRRDFRGEDAQEARELLAALLRSDGEPLVRAAAAVGLGRLGGPEAVDALKAGLQDRAELVRADVCRGLGRTGLSEAIEPLARTLTDDTSVDVRCGAARALEKFQERRARQALIDALEADRVAVRTAAWQTLRRNTGAKKLPPERAAWQEWLEREEAGQGAKGRRFLFW